MAWNEPGKNRNPWGNRPDRGAADLDEALRRLQRRLRGVFGGGGGSGGGNGGATDGGGRGFGIGTIVAVLLVIWGATGIYQVDAAERAVVTRFGRYVRTSEPGIGVHIPWPVESRRIVNVGSIETFNDQTRMLTLDENLVDLNIAVQFRRADPIAFSFNVRDPEETLGEVSESAIREIIGRSRLDFVLEEGRQEITARTKELVQRTLDIYKTGIEVTSVSLVGVSVPEQVIDQVRPGAAALQERGACFDRSHPPGNAGGEARADGRDRLLLRRAQLGHRARLQSRRISSASVSGSNGFGITPSAPSDL